MELTALLDDEREIRFHGWREVSMYGNYSAKPSVLEDAETLRCALNLPNHLIDTCNNDLFTPPIS